MGCAVGMGDDSQAASDWREGQSGAKAGQSTGNLPVTDGLRLRHDVALTAAPEFGGDPDRTSLAKDVLNEAPERDHKTFTSMPSVLRGASRSAGCSAKRCRALPALRVMFEARLEADEAFKANLNARLDFWISQLPVQDQGLNLYPILRSDRLVD